MNRFIPARNRVELGKIRTSARRQHTIRIHNLAARVRKGTFPIGEVSEEDARLVREFLERQEKRRATAR